MLDKIVINLSRNTRTIRNWIKDRKIIQKKTYNGTINEFFQEELEKFSYVRFLNIQRTLQVPYLTGFSGNKNFVLKNTTEKNNQLSLYPEICTFKCTIYKGKKGQTMYADLQNNNQTSLKYTYIKATKTN